MFRATTYENSLPLSPKHFILSIICSSYPGLVWLSNPIFLSSLFVPLLFPNLFRSSLYSCSKHSMLWQGISELTHTLCQKKPKPKQNTSFPGFTTVSLPVSPHLSSNTKLSDTEYSFPIHTPHSSYNFINT